jgi:hypothetical protein
MTESAKCVLLAGSANHSTDTSQWRRFSETYVDAVLRIASPVLWDLCMLRHLRLVENFGSPLGDDPYNTTSFPLNGYRNATFRDELANPRWVHKHVFARPADARIHMDTLVTMGDLHLSNMCAYTDDAAVAMMASLNIVFPASGDIRSMLDASKVVLDHDGNYITDPIHALNYIAKKFGLRSNDYTRNRAKNEYHYLAPLDNEHMQLFGTRAMQVVRALRLEFKHSGRDCHADPESVQSHIKLVIQNARGDQYENVFAKYEGIMTSEHQLLEMFNALSTADNVSKVPLQMTPTPPGMGPSGIPKIQQSGSPPEGNQPQRPERPNRPVRTPRVKLPVPKHASGKPYLRTKFDPETRLPDGPFNVGTPGPNGEPGNVPCDECGGGLHWIRDCPSRSAPAGGNVNNVSSVTMSSASTDGSNPGFHYTDRRNEMLSVRSVSAPAPPLATVGNHSAQAGPFAGQNVGDAVIEDQHYHDCPDWHADGTQRFLQVDDVYGSIAARPGGCMPPASRANHDDQLDSTTASATPGNAQHDIELVELQQLANSAGPTSASTELKCQAASVTTTPPIQAVSVEILATPVADSSPDFAGNEHVVTVEAVHAADCHCLRCSLAQASANTSLSPATRARANEITGNIDQADSGTSTQIVKVGATINSADHDSNAVATAPPGAPPSPPSSKRGPRSTWRGALLVIAVLAMLATYSALLTRTHANGHGSIDGGSRDLRRRLMSVTTSKTTSISMAADSVATKITVVTMAADSVQTRSAVATRMATTSMEADSITTKLTSDSVTASVHTEQYSPVLVQSASAPTRDMRDTSAPDSAEYMFSNGAHTHVDGDHDWRHGRHGATNKAHINVVTQLSVLGQTAQVLSMLTEYTRYHDQVWQHVHALLELMNFIATDERGLTDIMCLAAPTGRTGGILEALTTLSCMLVGVLGAKHHSARHKAARHKKLVEGHSAVANATTFVLSLEPGTVPVADTVPTTSSATSPRADRTSVASKTSPRTASHCSASTTERSGVKHGAAHAHVASTVPRAPRSLGTPAPERNVYVHADSTTANPTFGPFDFNDDVERGIRAAEASFLLRQHKPSASTTRGTLPVRAQTAAPGVHDETSPPISRNVVKLTELIQHSPKLTMTEHYELHEGALQEHNTFCHFLTLTVKGNAQCKSVTQQFRTRPVPAARSQKLAKADAYNQALPWALEILGTVRPSSSGPLLNTLQLEADFYLCFRGVHDTSNDETVLIKYNHFQALVHDIPAITPATVTQTRHDTLLAKDVSAKAYRTIRDNVLAHRKSRCTPFQVLQQCSIGTSQRFRLGNDSNPVMTLATPSQVHGFASIASIHGRAYLIVGVGSTSQGAKASFHQQFVNAILENADYDSPDDIVRKYDAYLASGQFHVIHGQVTDSANVADLVCKHMYAYQDHDRDFRQLQFSDSVSSVPLPSWAVLRVQPLYGEPRTYWAVGHSHLQAFQHCQQGVYSDLREQTIEAGPMRADLIGTNDYRTIGQDGAATYNPSDGIICIVHLTPDSHVCAGTMFTHVPRGEVHRLQEHFRIYFGPYDELITFQMTATGAKRVNTGHKPCTADPRHDGFAGSESCSRGSHLVRSADMVLIKTYLGWKVHYNLTCSAQTYYDSLRSSHQLDFGGDALVVSLPDRWDDLHTPYN